MTRVLTVDYDSLLVALGLPGDTRIQAPIKGGSITVERRDVTFIWEEPDDTGGNRASA